MIKRKGSLLTADKISVIFLVFNVRSRAVLAKIMAIAIIANTASIAIPVDNGIAGIEINAPVTASASKRTGALGLVGLAVVWAGTSDETAVSLVSMVSFVWFVSLATKLSCPPSIVPPVVPLSVVVVELAMTKASSWSKNVVSADTFVTNTTNKNSIIKI